MARTGVLETVQRIRRQLHSTGRNEINRLDAATLSGAASIVFEWDAPASVVEGAVLNINLELMRVISYTASTRTAQVIRGWLDSDPADHADQAEIVINPRFSNIDIMDAMVDEINSWGPALYRVESDEYAVASGDTVLQLKAAWSDCFGIINVYRQWSDQYQTTDAWPRLDVRFVRGVAADWTLGAPLSGLQLRFVEPVATGTVYVLVARPWATSAPTLAQNMVTDVGVPESYFDLLGMGVKRRLMADSELGRWARQSQDDSRRAEETPAGASVQPMQQQYAMYVTRLSAEVAKLRSQYPIRWT